MKKKKLLLFIAFFVVLQLAASFAYKRIFTHYTRAKMDLAEQQLREDGIPLNQTRPIMTALAGVTESVSSYTWNLAYLIILINGTALSLITLNQFRGQEAHPLEAQPNNSLNPTAS